MSGLGDELAEAVSGADALVHLHELQRIADAHVGNRAPGTAGYSASVAYATEVLAAAGYQVTTQDVPYTRFVVTSESIWLTEGDWSPRTLLMDDSPPLPGTVARLINLDATDGPPPASADLRGAVVLLARIPGGYAKQVMAAAEGGAVAMLLYTDTPCPANIYRLHWFGAGPPPIPVASISQDDARRLAVLAGAGRSVEVRLDWRGRHHDGNDQSVFASTGGSDTAGVVVGAHLDSVPEAPGINDNGSGVAAVLQTAVRLASARGSATRPVTFALWAAEELVNVGSTYHVSQLADAQRRATALYLNAEMIASPNYVPYVMRGEGTVTTPFDTYFQARRIGYEYIDVTAIGSDHHPFRDAGIPVGGLHCGSVGLKTQAEQARYRGTEGQLYDPGYHQPSDTVCNISLDALDLTTRALAYAVGWAGQG
jgi:Zn-dependent M28 family amino/carboxypeptidase